MSNNLGCIYARTVIGTKKIIIDSDSVDVSENFFINGTNSRMPAEFENSIRNYLPLTYGTTICNSNTLFDIISEVSTPDGNDVTHKERGLIAQHLLNTDLSYILSGGTMETITDPAGMEIKYIHYGVRYNDLCVTLCSAVKELSSKGATLEQVDSIVLVQETKISNLEIENNLLKSKLNEILSEMGKETI